MAPHGPPPETQGDGALPQLVQEILDKLASDDVLCMVCQDNVLRSAPIWCCERCFSIFHLPCIRKWVRSSASAAGSWRCLGCQFVYFTRDEDLAYTCFCGRRRDPPNDHFLTPHSCGEPCSRPLERAEPPGAQGEDADDATGCSHLCLLRCHPGPCPPCRAFLPGRPCLCGKEMVARRCGDRDQSTPVTCGRPCEQALTCGRHPCEKVCHTGPCGSCTVVISARCFCGKTVKKLKCGETAEIMSKGFCCIKVCGRTLACGNHACKDLCHQGPCVECRLMPENITGCHCGKTRLQERRESCLDALPKCDKTCDKKLLCGHTCKVKCHMGECPPCSLRIEKKCVCGSSTQNFRCCYKESIQEFFCNKCCYRP